MPWSIILRPPGGYSGVTQNYTAREKIAILSKICHIKRETNVSFARLLLVRISHTLVFHWHALCEWYNNIDVKKLPHYSAHHGPCGQLESVNEDLLTWIFERRETGLVVLTYSIVIKACCLLSLMEQKSALARYMVMRRFLKNTQSYAAWGWRCHSIPPVRCAKRRRSSRTLFVRCSKDQSGIYAGSSIWTRCQYIFQCIPKTMLEILGTKNRCYQDLNKQHNTCYHCARHHGSRQLVGPHGYVQGNGEWHGQEMQAPQPRAYYVHLRNTGQCVDGQEGDVALGGRCTCAVHFTRPSRYHPHNPPGFIPLSTSWHWLLTWSRT